jgi:prepilin-type N-terminal cleavage/methylation domain-containing protein
MNAIFKKTSPSAGFTLIEVLVSLVIFSIVVTIAIGAILSLVDVGEKARSLNSVMENLNTALETMARTVRVGDGYNCYSTDRVVACGANGSPQIGLEFTPSTLPGALSVAYFLSINSPAGVTPQYGQIFETVHYGGSTADQTFPVTAGEVHVTNLTFRIYNQGGNANALFAQPYVLMDVDGFVESRSENSVSFNLQTTMTQR